MPQPLPLERFDFFSLQDFATPFVAETVAAIDDIAEDVAEQAEAPPPPPSISEAEVEAAKQAAYEEGLAAGREEAEKEFQMEGLEATKKLAQSTELITEKMQDAQDVMNQHIAEQQDNLLGCAKLIAQKLALSALEKNAEHVLQDMVQHCLPHIIREPKLVITVAPEMAERLVFILDDASEKTGFKGEYAIHHDDSLQAGDIRLEWHNGSAEHSFAQVLEEMDVLFAHASQPSIVELEQPLTDIVENEAEPLKESSLNS